MTDKITFAELCQNSGLIEDKPYEAVATYSAPVQIGPDTWTMRGTSMKICNKTTVRDIRNWLKKITGQDLSRLGITDVTFSEIEE